MSDIATTVQRANILLIEDNPDDVRLTQETLIDGKIENELLVAQDGVEAFAMLRCQGPYAGMPRPDLILLDLNLPKMDGHEFLAELRDDPILRAIPVIILTTSEASEDIRLTYELDAVCYITKPLNMDQFLGVLRATEPFRFAIVKAPA